jgi:DmsE family decaheme c-type cytochrome
MRKRAAGWALQGLFAVAILSSSAFARPPQEAAKGDQATPAPAAAAANPSPTQRCQKCHAPEYSSWEKSAHFRTTLDKHADASHQGCESCHGQMAEHLADPTDTSKMFRFKDKPAKEISARCLQCHTYTAEHSNFSRSVHLQNNVSCIDCHSPHHAKEGEHLMRERSPQLCYGCHQEAKQQFARPFHHRVNEGLVSCNDCHNPHGANIARQLRATSSQDLVCFKCHADKAGPFVFEHQPVKIEGCVACHTPHGSSNPRLLKRSQVNVLCLECHSISLDTTGVGVEGPLPQGPAHNQNQKYQACTMCHTQIHGSNFSFVFFK